MKDWAVAFTAAACVLWLVIWGVHILLTYWG